MEAGTRASRGAMQKPVNNLETKREIRDLEAAAQKQVTINPRVVNR
jgi:hypothetical protein